MCNPLPKATRQDWLASLDKEEAASEEGVQPAAEGDMPDWLSSLGTDGAETAPEQEAEKPAAEGETPDWLSSMGEGAPELEDVSDELEFPALVSEEPAQEEDLAPSEVADDNDTLTSADDVDALFAMDMPDWLSDAGAQESEGQALETPAEDGSGWFTSC